MVNCPVCEKNLPDPLPSFCEQCGWEVLLFLEEIPEDIEKEYHQRLEIAKRTWQAALESKELKEKPTEAKAPPQKPDMTLAELNKGTVFKCAPRDSFETPEEYTARLISHNAHLESMGFLPAGEARLLKDRYDVNSGRFPLEVVVWEKWLEHLAPFNKADLFITAERDQARAAYLCGEKHPLEASMRVLDGVPQLATLRLKTPAELFTVIKYVIDGPFLVSGSYDKTVRLWDAATGKELCTLSGHTSSVNSVTFSPDGRLLASGSVDNTVRLWDVASGKELRTLSGHIDKVCSVAFSPDGRLLASGSGGHESRDNTVRLWDPATGRELCTLSGHTSSVNSVAFSPDGRLLASGSYDKTVRLWDAASGKELRTLCGHKGSVSSVAFSPDGCLLASGSYDHTVRLWDAASGKGLRTIRGHTILIALSVAFSPDGRLLASGHWDYIVRIWDATTGKELRTLSGHACMVCSVAFSPDGRLLASGSWDHTVRLWDTATGRELHTLSRHTEAVHSVAFSPVKKVRS